MAQTSEVVDDYPGAAAVVETTTSHALSLRTRLFPFYQVSMLTDLFFLEQLLAL
jgi:hypothetical protein